MNCEMGSESVSETNKTTKDKTEAARFQNVRRLFAELGAVKSEREVVGSGVG